MDLGEISLPLASGQRLSGGYQLESQNVPYISPQLCYNLQIPEFDNFYLDMNGIIHACSHPNDDNPTFRISEDKIFNDIFRYIEVSGLCILHIPKVCLPA